MTPREVVVRSPGVSILMAIFPSSRITEAFPSLGTNFEEDCCGRNDSVENELVGAFAIINRNERKISLKRSFDELISLV